MSDLELVSHHLCPYVQRAAITLAEKGVPFRRTTIDLSAKPEWFIAISPLGKVPLLRTGDGGVLFESAAICDYLDEVYAPRLHPEGAFERAEHRAWIAYASTILDVIGGLYNAPDEAAFEEKVQLLAERFERLEETLTEKGPWFAGDRFSIVDAAFGPVFRYFDTLERFVFLGVFGGKPKVRAWRAALARRASIAQAVDGDYPRRLELFLRARGGHLARLINAAAPAAAA
jgi:glutathione S-transferase